MVQLFALTRLESATVSSLAFADPRIAKRDDFIGAAHSDLTILVQKHEFEEIPDEPIIVIDGLQSMLPPHHEIARQSLQGNRFDIDRAFAFPRL